MRTRMRRAFDASGTLEAHAQTRHWRRCGGASLAGWAACFAGLLAGGCLQRTVTVTSEPPGADVYLNDTHIGRTPAKADFQYYGTYDLRVRKAGYNPVITSAEVDMPLYELPPLDLAMSAWPGTIKTDRAQHVMLTPQSGESTPADRAALLERAKAMKAELPEKAETEGSAESEEVSATAKPGGER